MKTLASLFILLFAIQNASAQLYLTAGVSRSNEGVITNDRKIYQDIFSSTNKDRFRYDFFELGVVYKKEGLLIAGNLGLTYKNLHLSGAQTCPWGITNVQFNKNEIHYKSFDVKYAYLGPKLTVSKAFFHKDNFNLNAGGFVNLELLLGEKESNHYDSLVLNSSGFFYDPVTMQNVPYYNDTYMISRAEYGGVETIGALLSLGITLSPSYTINRFRIAASFSLGVNFDQRTDYDIYDCANPPEKQKLFFPQFGLSVGYQLERKSD